MNLAIFTFTDFIHFYSVITGNIQVPLLYLYLLAGEYSCAAYVNKRHVDQNPLQDA